MFRIFTRLPSGPRHSGRRLMAGRPHGADRYGARSYRDLRKIHPEYTSDTTRIQDGRRERRKRMPGKPAQGRKWWLVLTIEAGNRRGAALLTPPRGPGVSWSSREGGRWRLRG